MLPIELEAEAEVVAVLSACSPRSSSIWKSAEGLEAALFVLAIEERILLEGHCVGSPKVAANSCL